MRDRRFVARHRGGSLTKEQHHLLMRWACDCAEHVLHLFGEEVDERLKEALRLARQWEHGETSVGDARRASLDAIAVAKRSSALTSVSVARSVGHAVATAHMADHSMAAALYALKAIKAEGKSVDEERKWQDEQLPEKIRGLVLSARSWNRR